MCHTNAHDYNIMQINQSSHIVIDETTENFESNYTNTFQMNDTQYQYKDHDLSDQINGLKRELIDYAEKIHELKNINENYRQEKSEMKNIITSMEQERISIVQQYEQKVEMLSNQ